MNKKDIGSIYETKAVKYLKSLKYKILHKNYKTKYGEIDIVSYDKKEKCIVFVEVRFRKNNSYGTPSETVNTNKQKRIIYSAICYLKRFNKVLNNIRFDVISFTEDNNKIEHIKNAFQLTPPYIYHI